MWMNTSPASLNDDCAGHRRPFSRRRPKTIGSRRRRTRPPSPAATLTFAVRIRALDYLIAKYGGRREELKLLRDVARGAYELAPFSATDVMAAEAVIERYADLDIGLADASLVVLAGRYQCYDILTLDQRHFRALRAPNGASFRLLPDDDRS